MKKGFLDKWKNISECQNLLFFAQLVNEQIFDYSIPSNRMATLNSHYLCLDALSAINDIDNHGVPEGTLKPIMEELYSSLEKDIAFNSSEIKPLDLFVKQDVNTYKKIFNIKDLNYNDSKRIVYAIHQKYFSGDLYLGLLKKLIVELIESNDVQKQGELHKVTKSFLTELVNFGYSTRYIYDTLIYVFFNKKTTVKSTSRISRFLDAFTFEEKKYTVFFIADKSFENVTSQYEMYTTKTQLIARNELEKEHAYLNKKYNEQYYVVEKLTATDAYAAADSLIEIFMVQDSIYRLGNHYLKHDISECKIGIYDENNYFTIYKAPKNPVKKARTIPTSLIEENLTRVRTATSQAFKDDYINGQALINAVNFHALSIDSTSKENQLLDLWAVFETLLDISNKHTSDRIQQVVNVLVPILKQGYIYSLFQQLSNDIKNYSEDLFDSIVKGGTDNEIISIAKLILLNEYEQELSNLTSALVDFPLLKERILYYKQVLSSKKAIYDFVEKHTLRIKWQIMRIYRNRNLIIHNGRSMPYLSLLIENLHSYVDDFLDYMINGYVSKQGKEIIYQELFLNECEWTAYMNVKKSPIDASTIEYIMRKY